MVELASYKDTSKAKQGHFLHSGFGAWRAERTLSVPCCVTLTSTRTAVLQRVRWFALYSSSQETQGPVPRRDPSAREAVSCALSIATDFRSIILAAASADDHTWRS